MESGALYNFGKSLHKLGEMLIEDDINDLGYFSYYGREKGNPHIGWGTGNHPTPWHHWQVGGAFVVLGQALGMYALAKELEDDEEPQSVFKMPTYF